jgi:hypothetical protein
MVFYARTPPHSGLSLRASAGTIGANIFSPARVFRHDAWSVSSNPSPTVQHFVKCVRLNIHHRTDPTKTAPHHCPPMDTQREKPINGFGGKDRVENGVPKSIKVHKGIVTRFTILSRGIIEIVANCFGQPDRRRCKPNPRRICLRFYREQQRLVGWASSGHPLPA